MTNDTDNAPLEELRDKIFLIGFMGVGKTYWGKIWARQLDLDFYDLDEIIETAQGRSIASIFEKEGEAYFRNLETAALQNFGEKKNYLVACGGGVACFNDNIHWMNKNGTSVYLSASPQLILNRVLKEKIKRPLISKLNETELLVYIEQKLTEREPFYKQAKHRLTADRVDMYSLSKL